MRGDRSLAAVALIVSVACGGEGGSRADELDGAAGARSGRGPFGDLSELTEQGVDRYFGVADPIVTEVVDDATVYDFAPADGPVCLRGGPFNVAVRDRGTSDVLVYLEGGGACSPTACTAMATALRGIPRIGILNPEDAANPVADWNVVYVPYCDGSVLTGDSAIPSGVDPSGERTHHGLQNISAALDIAQEMFPGPERVLLAGSSGGGFGTVYDRILVRLKYPRADLFVMNDAGIGLHSRSDILVQAWNTSRFAPPSCGECAVSDHATPIAQWFFEHDANVVVGVFTSWEDAVIRQFTSPPEPAVLRRQLAEETGQLEAAFPDRYGRFIVEGDQHTALQRDPFDATRSGDVTLPAWIGMMLDRDPAWVDVVE